LPFCWDVYGQERRREMLWLEKKVREAVESNSRPLSVWNATIGKRN
jgi:hypothetical protein